MPLPLWLPGGKLSADEGYLVELSLSDMYLLLAVMQVSVS